MRLIDADDLFKNKIIVVKDSDSLEVIEKIMDIIKEAPTIGTEPIRRGHWIFTNKPNIYGGTSIKCSECGYEGMVAHIEDHHYCWFCGAKMDDEVNDEAEDT